MSGLMIKSGKNAKFESINMLKEILKGTSLTHTEQAFRKRKEKGTKENKLNSKFFKRIIQDLEEKETD